MFSLICRADSVTWNPHKLMGALLQCSTIHFKENVSLSLINVANTLFCLRETIGVEFDYFKSVLLQDSQEFSISHSNTLC